MHYCFFILPNGMSYVDNIEEITKINKNYREVIHTTTQQQLVVMNIPYNVDIGFETHFHTTQFIKVEKGNGEAIIGTKKFKITAGDVVMIAANTKHNIISKSKSGLKLYTIYSPPEHKKNLIQKNKP